LQGGLIRKFVYFAGGVGLTGGVLVVYFQDGRGVTIFISPPLNSAEFGLTHDKVKLRAPWGCMESAVRLIEYSDLDICDMCEDYWCRKHEVHFYDCSCRLRIWADDDSYED